MLRMVGGPVPNSYVIANTDFAEKRNGRPNPGTIIVGWGYCLVPALTFIPPLLPTFTARPPQGAQGEPEIKFDGYRTDICLISGNDISREGLSRILESQQFNIVGSFNSISGIGNASLSSELLVVVDFIGSELQVDSVQMLKRLYPSLRVVVLSNHFDMKSVVACFNAGAHGYIIKSMKSPPLIMGLRLVALGEKVLPPDFIEVLCRQLVDAQSTAEREHDIEDAHLSPREFDVLYCLMAGNANKVIARQLEVCEATIKAHVKAILRKLRVRNRTQAAIWASHRGLTGNYLPA